MHELSLAEALVEEIERIAARENALRALRVTLRVGALSGADPEALRFAFPVAAEGTVAAGAELAIETEPFRVRCAACGAETEADPLDVRCPACGATTVEAVGGADLALRAVEFAVDSEMAP